MRVINLSPSAGFDEWRGYARACLSKNIPPDNILWDLQDGGEQDLFAQSSLLPLPVMQTCSVSKQFLELAAIAACHSDPYRFGLLYRVLWRLRHEYKNLLRLKTDDDILSLQSHVKAVRRDAYKIKAFLRFREIQDELGPHFIAWYQPEHYTLELSLPFFQTRFRNMRWTILTPYIAAYWNQETLALTSDVNLAQYPENDDVESHWLKYYSTIFNPARVKKQAMLNQMPKKYWKNMPESILINDMLRRAESRTLDMLEIGGLEFLERQETGHDS